MKKIIGLILVTFFISVSLFATDYIDVIEKKDGSILKGIIFENKIGDFVKIELQGGSVFKIDYSEIDTMKKEKSVLDTNSGASNIVINTSATSESNSVSNTEKAIMGYSLTELNLMFMDATYSDLVALDISKSKMLDTNLIFRVTEYNANDQGSVIGFTIANWLLPGSGSLCQGDYKSGGITIALNTICGIVFYGAYFSYLSEITQYDSETGRSINNDTRAQQATMVSSLAVWSLTNVIQLFAPLNYKRKYNNKLSEKLQYKS